MQLRVKLIHQFVEKEETISVKLHSEPEDENGTATMSDLHALPFTWDESERSSRHASQGYDNQGTLIIKTYRKCKTS